MSDPFTPLGPGLAKLITTVLMRGPHLPDLIEARLSGEITRDHFFDSLEEQAEQAYRNLTSSQEVG